MRSNVTMVSALAALLAFTFAPNISAQAGGTRVAGTVVSFDGQTLVVKSADGQSTSVSVPPELSIRSSVKATLADIKPGDFVASAADKGADGKIHAEELRIFPEAMRGLGEGHRPMGPDPNRTMTNGTVALSDPEARTMTNGTVSATGGSGNRTLTVQYKDGQTDIVIGPETPISKIVIADRSVLRPGASVTVAAAQKNGALAATNVTVDGAK